MLIAAAITSVINIINQVEIVTALKRLLLVIIIFYILGLVLKSVMKVALSKFAEKEQTGEKQEEQQPEEEKK
jgi:flagellar biosynthesis/type III secretory pathway M-ring protein FliF/YscJ